MRAGPRHPTPRRRRVGGNAEQEPAGDSGWRGRRGRGGGRAAPSHTAQAARGRKRRTRTSGRHRLSMMPFARAEVRTVVPQPSEIDQQWGQVRGLLRAEVGDTAYSTWLKPLDLACLDGDRVVIAVPTQFMRDWVVAHYADRIRALWTTINPGVRSVALNVAGLAAAGRPGAA